MHMLNFISKIIVFVLNIIRIVFIIILLLTILGWIVPYISNIESYPYLHNVTNFETTINHTVKHYIPTKIVGYDFSRLITIIILFILMNLTQSISDQLKFAMRKRKMRLEFQTIQKTYNSPQHKEKLELLESKLEQVNLASGKNRQELLKDFVNLKKELEKIGRDLAFLAIDVVDSTGMKQGEDQEIVEHDFIEYHNFVEAKFKEHGYIKASWTPDGVMACFNTIENAVQTAQSIIEGLKYFNQKVKVMKKDFQIRCGVNGGFVYYDDSIPLEQFSDRTLDIAGHMQKHAPPNTILIAKQIIEPVKSHDDFQPIKKLVDGLEVCEWNKIEDKKS